MLPAVFLLLLILGCSNREPVAEPQKKVETPVIFIGLIPEHNLFKQIERYEPLAAYLSKKTGVTVKLKVMSRYGNIVENFVSEHLDGAFFGSFTYALAHSMLGVEVLARPELSDGTSTYHGHIFVRKDSGIRSAADMKGKRFAFVDRATTAGYIFPISYFRKNGIVNYKKYLKEAYFTGTHEDTIDDVLTGRADIGAAKNTVYDRIENEDKRIKKELVIIAESRDVPENGLAVRKDLDSSIRNKLKSALLAMDTDQEGIDALQSLGAKRFIDTTEADYKYVYEYARETGIDLARYDYRNDR